MRPKVVIAGILDTKGEEIKFIAQAVREAGGEPTVMELSVGKETGWADIGLSELLVPIGKKPADLYAVDRHKAAGWVTEAAILRAGEMLREGKLDGIIGFGGSMGASISSAVMQSLPIGVPKMLVTTMASGEVRPYVGTKDICMMYPIARGRPEQPDKADIDKRSLWHSRHGLRTEAASRGEQTADRMHDVRRYNALRTACLTEYGEAGLRRHN